MARDLGVAHVQTGYDVLARHVTRLVADDVQFDDIEELLTAWQRSGHLSRVEMVNLQAACLREARQ